MRFPGLWLIGAVALLLSACGGDEREGTSPTDQRLEHVHGLGVNPADGRLYIATHHGLFRLPERSEEPERVGEGRQDTMGFTIIGPDHFLASGHPAPGEPGPSHLGLIESTDGGMTWSEVSLGGEADFHALRFAHDRVYGYDATSGTLFLSDDEGASWTERRPPAAVIDLAVDPTDPERIIASTERGLALSANDGRRWQPVGRGNQIGLLAWPVRERLYLIDHRGRVQMSSDDGERWENVGTIGGQPAAFIAEDDGEFVAALSDGTILRSSDAGSSWD